MTTRERVLATLRGAEANRIRFTFNSTGGAITINRAAFERVARAIERGNLHVRVVTTFRAGVGAQYRSDTNVIETPPVIGRADQGLILHECTHAYYDLISKNLMAVDDEASAYVVDALFFRMTGLPRPRWNATLHAMAGHVADDLLRQYQAGVYAPPEVSSLLWWPLKLLIASDPVYAPTPASTGGVYLRDG
jgi:hypothetical protein